MTYVRDCTYDSVCYSADSESFDSEVYTSLDTEVCESETAVQQDSSNFDSYTLTETLYFREGDSQCECIDWTHYDLSRFRLERNDLKLLALDSGRGEFQLTLQQKMIDLAPGFDFTVSIVPKDERISIEIKDFISDITFKQLSSEQEVFRIRLLKALFVIFSTPVGDVPEHQRISILNHVESVMMFSSDEIYKPKHLLPADAQREEMDAITKARYDKTSTFINPRVTPDLMLNTSHETVSIVWRAEKRVSEKLASKIQQAMDRMPYQLIDALQYEKKLETLKIEVVEDDMINLRVENALAFHQSGINLIGLRRSYIHQSSVEQIASTLMHEFAHVIHPRQSDNYIKPYYSALLDQQDDSHYPFVSTYARYTEYEFFAESVVAYFNGEVETAPANELLRGPRDRRELREKTPELYLSLMIYFDPSLSSECEEDFDVFDQEAFGLIANHILTHPLNSQQDDRRVAEIFLESLNG